MFKEFAARPRILATACASLVLALSVQDRAFAAKTVQECGVDHKVCYTIACKAEGEWCFRQCDAALFACIEKATGGAKVDTPPDPIHPKGGHTHTPPTGGTKEPKHPNKPPKTGEHTPPTGGTKADPKKPPKVNDPRAPSGGGVFHPKTSGAGTSGPILRTNGAPSPIQKSSGGNGPSSGSINGRR